MKKLVSLMALIAVFGAFFTHKTPALVAVSDNIEDKTVQLGGEPFGIRMFSDGVLVIEVEDALYGSDTPSPAFKAGIKANDIIKSANGEALYSNEQFTDIIVNSNNTSLDLEIIRNGKIINISLIPEYDSKGIPRAGLWIKDSAAGIGTVTYYDTESQTFGALGHGICESKTGTLIPLSYGEIAKATINSVSKSENGNVGSLNGYFDGEAIGKAYNNTDNGIFGHLSCITQNESIEIADKEEVKIGDAQIYCTVNGNIKDCYDIKIKRLSDTMVIEITDPQLLEITGGIVQGMSGSPIVQNGKLIGAVTHVLVNNVKYGYGIYIEDMIAES